LPFVAPLDTADTLLSKGDQAMSVADRGMPGDHRLAAEELAILLAAQPDMLAKLLAEHQDDGRGHCRVCTLGGQRGHQSWPCNIATVAQRATQIRDAKAEQ
jgi:hypothetical protein